MLNWLDLECVLPWEKEETERMEREDVSRVVGVVLVR